MKPRRTLYACFLSVIALAGVPSNAQSGDKGKPTIYTYISEWLFRGCNGPRW
jgi:hypothetical protein